MKTRQALLFTFDAEFESMVRQGAHEHIIVRLAIFDGQCAVIKSRHSSDEPDWISCLVFLQRVSRSRCPLH